MMKATNYEISKQLEKNGLSEKLGFIDYYYNTDKQLRRRYEETYYELENIQVDCFAYDLETILEQINFVIHDVEKSKIFWFQMNQQDFGYRSFEGETLIDFYIVRQKNESLADTAARLWLKLKKEGLS